MQTPVNMDNTILQQSLTFLYSVIFILTAVGFGSFILSRSRIVFDSSAEKIFFCSGVGFLTIGYSVFILGLLQLFSPAPLYTFLILLVIPSLTGLFHLRKGISEPAQTQPQSQWDRATAPILVIGLTCGLLLVLTPETGKDALIYHLAVPKLFLKHGGIYFIQGNIFSHYPLHSEMLLLVGLFLRGDVMAKCMHFVALLLVLLGMYQFSRRPFLENSFPLLSLAVFYTIPSVFITSAMAYNDLFVTFYSMGAVFAFFNWFHRGETGWLIMCGVFSGTAVASKYTCLVLPLLGCLGVLWSARRNNTSYRDTLLFLFLYLSTVLVVGSPFYLKNWIMTGNPVYPFFYDIFGGRGWDREQARFYDFFVQNLGMGRDFTDYILLPWNLSFRAEINSPRFDGILGPIFLLTLPFALGMRHIGITMKIILAYCMITFLFWSSTAQQMRYLIPVFPFLAILTGVILTYYRNKRFIFGMLVLLISLSVTFNLYHISRDMLRIRPVGVVIGRESTEAFMHRMLPSYSIFQYANKNLPGDSKIFLIYMKNLTYLCDHDCYSDSMFESYTMQKIISSSTSSDMIRQKLKAWGFTHILYDHTYVYGSPSTFSPEEKSLFLNFQRQYLSAVAVKEPYYLFRIE
jgi:hypothetical protein